MKHIHILVLLIALLPVFLPAGSIAAAVSAPSISMSPIPDTNGAVTDNTPTVTGLVSEDIRMVRLYLNEAPVASFDFSCDIPAPCEVDDAAAGNTFSYTFTKLADGNYDVYALGYDVDDHKSAPSNVLRFIVNTTVADVTIPNTPALPLTGFSLWALIVALTAYIW